MITLVTAAHANAAAVTGGRGPRWRVILNRHLCPNMPNARTNQPRAQYWVYTLNNYTEDELNHFINLNHEKVAFHSFGKEVGENGTPHLQGHLELRSRMRMAQAKQLLCARVHLEVRRGSFEQAQQYVEKDGDVHMYGQRISKGAGARSDLVAVHEALREGQSLRAISNEYFSAFVRYQRGITAWKNLNSAHVAQQKSIIVYHGRTGSGKTRAVHDNLPSTEDLWCYPGSGWFDGYDGQSIALFDDFSGGEFKINYLLKLLDRYPMQVAVKGGFVQWCPQEIYLTSNLKPEDWYRNAHPEHVRALFRRFTNVVHFE